MMFNKDEKIVRSAPCLYLDWDDSKQRWEHRSPAVRCSFDCGSCPWNPNEQERRLATGTWVKNDKGVRHLKFRSAK